MDTGEQILQAALGQFSRRGYHAVSIRDICGEVGIRESSLYYHFKNERALLDALVARFAEKAGRFTTLLDEGVAQLTELEDEAFLRVGTGYVQGYLLDPEILAFFGMLRIEREHDPALQRCTGNGILTVRFSSRPACSPACRRRAASPPGRSSGWPCCIWRPSFFSMSGSFRWTAPRPGPGCWRRCAATWKIF